MDMQARAPRLGLQEHRDGERAQGEAYLDREIVEGPPIHHRLQLHGRAVHTVVLGTDPHATLWSPPRAHGVGRPARPLLRIIEPVPYHRRRRRARFAAHQVGGLGGDDHPPCRRQLPVAGMQA